MFLFYSLPSVCQYFPKKMGGQANCSTSPKNVYCFVLPRIFQLVFHDVGDPVDENDAALLVQPTIKINRLDECGARNIEVLAHIVVAKHAKRRIGKILFPDTPALFSADGDCIQTPAIGRLFCLPPQRTPSPRMENLPTFGANDVVNNVQSCIHDIILQKKN